MFNRPTNINELRRANPHPLVALFIRDILFKAKINCTFSIQNDTVLIDVNGWESLFTGLKNYLTNIQLPFSPIVNNKIEIILSALLEHSIMQEVLDRDLMNKAFNGRAEQAYFLIYYGANANYTDPAKNSTALQLAMSWNKKISYMLVANADEQLPDTLPPLTEKALFIYDFDLTICSGHSYNEIVKANFSKQKAEEQLEYLRSTPNFAPTGIKNECKDEIGRLLDKGHHVAIASFNCFTGMIKLYLEKAVGLSKAQCEKIIIKTGPQSQGKNILINDIKSRLQGKFTACYFIDDDKKNVDAAETVVDVCILADKYGTHHPYIMDIVNRLPCMDNDEQVTILRNKMIQCLDDFVREQPGFLESSRPRNRKSLTHFDSANDLKIFLSTTTVNNKDELIGTISDKLSSLELNTYGLRCLQTVIQNHLSIIQSECLQR